MNGLCGGTDNVDDEAWMGQHRDVAAVNNVGARVHPFREEALQFRLNRAVMVRDDIPTRLRLPGDTGCVPAEEIESRGVMGRPNKFLLFLREVSREALDAFRPHPEAPVSWFDKFEDVGGRVRRLLALRCFAGIDVGRESGDVYESDDAIIGARGRNHASSIGVADEDGRAANPPERPIDRGHVTFGCVEPVLGGHYFVAVRL